MLRNFLAFAAASAVLVATVPAPAAPPPVEGFAVVNGDATVVRSTGFSGFHVSPGVYELDYPVPMPKCAYIVTAGSGDATVPPRSFAVAVGRRELPTAIMVTTYDGSGQPADLGFHLIVRC